jgi:DNA-binding protein HU-beta
MTKQDLAAKVASKAGISQHQAVKAVEVFMETVVETVAVGGGVYLRGFGTFRSVIRQAKKARDISRGETLTIPATRKPVFKPSKEFLGRVKK